MPRTKITREQIDVILSETITESTKLFFTEPRVLSTVLTGFLPGNATPIVSTDTLLQALGKLQGQITNTTGVGTWGLITGVITDQTDLLDFLTANYTPISRNLTINGVTYDLSSDRSWTITTAANYQEIQQNTSPATARPTLNFSNQFSIVDNSSNTSTDVSIASLDWTRITSKPTLQPNVLEFVGNQITVTSNLNGVTASKILFLPNKDGAFRAGRDIGGFRWDVSNIGNASTAFGYDTEAPGTWSFAAGISSSASGTASFAAGASATASGYGSIAIGQSSTASGTGSVTLGLVLTAKAQGGVAFGSYNDDTDTVLGTFPQPLDRIFQLGIGSQGVSSQTKKNAITVLRNGNVGIGVTALTPTETLEIHGTFKLVNSTEGAGKFLTSDASGVGTWTSLSLNNWSLAGNSGTNPTTDFIGTTDLTDFVIRTNNLRRITVKDDGKVGIGIDIPTEAVDVLGNVQFTGALMPNGNAGTTNKVLKSAGANVPPIWGDVKSNISRWITSLVETIDIDDTLVISGDLILDDSLLNINGTSNEIVTGSLIFKEVGQVFIGGNLVLRDSNIINNGELSVAGGIILLGTSTITGTGIII